MPANPGGQPPLVNPADNPPYEPERWNQPGTQDSNNCYSYGANNPDGHPAGDKPQPGEASNTPLDDVTCEAVNRSVIADGMVPAGNPPVNWPGYYLVALVVDPGVDYHWYRQDNNGMWSHKPGHGEATNLDASGNVITNPAAANRDYSPNVNYSNFCGYYYVPAGGMSTGTP